jgi:hypothetical protein
MIYDIVTDSRFWTVAAEVTWFQKLSNMSHISLHFRITTNYKDVMINFAGIIEVVKTTNTITKNQT